MNLASQAGEPDRKLLFVNFNQNYTGPRNGAARPRRVLLTHRARLLAPASSAFVDGVVMSSFVSLAVGTKTGYKLYSLDSIDKLEPIYCSEHERQVCIIERLFVSSLIALVSLDSPRKLKVCHFKKGTEICNYSYSNSILAVRLNRQRLVVCLEESLYIHNIRDMKVMHTIKETPPNPRGLCVLSTGNDDSYLAYPGSSQNGNVQVFDTLKLRCVTSLHAHDNPIAALAFNSSGSRLATASEKGTVIRVFSIPDGAKLFDFRRGMKRCVSISSLAFSADSLYVAAASNTETVHVFKLEKKEDKPAADDAASQGWAGYVTQALRSSASYLPSQVTDVFNQWRSFATAHLPNPAQKAVCGIAVIQKAPRMLVATEEGNLYVYNLDPKDGGECVLVKTLRIDEIRPPAISEPPLPASAVDRPLTATTPVNVATVTYAASVRRNDSSNVLARSPTAGPHNAVGLLSHDNSSFYSLAPASTNQTAAAGGASAAAAARVASSGAAEHLAGTLRLDDASEFPPMTPGYD